MAAMQTCCYCGAAVMIRHDLDTDEKSICDSCFMDKVRDIKRGKEYLKEKKHGTLELSSNQANVQD